MNEYWCGKCGRKKHASQFERDHWKPKRGVSVECLTCIKKKQIKGLICCIECKKTKAGWRFKVTSESYSRRCDECRGVRCEQVKASQGRNKKPMTADCGWCGKKFSVNDYRRRYCSDLHRMLSDNEKALIRREQKMKAKRAEGAA